MARNDGAVAEHDVEFDEEELTADGEVDLNKLQTDFAFRGPVAMRLEVEERAAEAQLGVSQYLRKVVADAVGFSLQSNSGRTPMTEEQKKAKAEEAKQKAKEERARIRALLDQQRQSAGISTGK